MKPMAEAIGEHVRGQHAVQVDDVAAMKPMAEAIGE